MLMLKAKFMCCYMYLLDHVNANALVMYGCLAIQTSTFSQY